MPVVVRRAPHPQLGVIADARRRRRRRHGGLLAVAILAVGAGLAFAGGPGAPHRAPARLDSSLRYLSGPLAGATGLRLIAAENAGRPYLVDVDHGTAVPVAGMGLPRSVGAAATGTSVYPLVRHGSEVLAFVARRACLRCGETVSAFLIDRAGRARRLWTLALGYHQTFVPAAGSTAVWVSSWPHAAPCSLAREPGSRAVRVPCGALSAVTSAGAWIANGDVTMLVDPTSGRVRVRLHTAQVLAPIRGSLALEFAPQDGTRLALVDVLRGSRRSLPWPSALHFSVQAIPQPDGPLIALRFGEPWYPPSQAVDLWVLDPRTGSLTHVPGLPALELLKVSGASWSPGGKLVIASAGAARTVVGVWRPGERVTAVRTVPSIQGYSQFAALGS
jgi:hypothetical protein